MRKAISVLICLVIFLTTAIPATAAGQANTMPKWLPVTDSAYDCFSPALAAVFRQAAKNDGGITVKDKTYWLVPFTQEQAQAVTVLRKQADLTKFPYHFRTTWYKELQESHKLLDSDLLDLQILEAVNYRADYVGKPDPGYPRENVLKEYIVWDPAVGGWWLFHADYDGGRWSGNTPRYYGSWRFMEAGGVMNGLYNGEDWLPTSPDMKEGVEAQYHEVWRRMTEDYGWDRPYPKVY